MLTSMKLGLATTVAALSIAAVTSAGAAVNPTSAGEIVDQLAVREQSIVSAEPSSFQLYSLS